MAMKSRKITKALVLASIVAGTFVAGCELVVDFDRTKIPVDVSEASVIDANTADTGTGITDDAATDAGDAGDAGDASITDAGSDADAGDGAT